MSEQPEEPTITPVNNRAAPQKTEPNRLPFWILISVSLGFFLPVCACAMLMLTSIGSTALLPTPGGSGVISSGGFGDAVAIVRVEGTITNSDESDSATGAVSGTIVSDLQAAAADNTVKAIILRVDSPGGTVTGSAQIYDAILEMDKPVIVSMAGTAASGGYYVSAPADYIFARPDTTTGSIGVILTVYNIEGMLEKVGVEVTSITSGVNKGIGNPWETLTPDQTAILEEYIDESYDEFVRIIVDGRNLPEEDVIALADGRIYSGRQALELKLVDELGDLDDAIAKAAELGGITGEPRLIEYEHIPTLQDLFLGFSGKMSQSEAEQALQLLNELSAPTLEYRYIGLGSQ
jgi:protease-4